MTTAPLVRPTPKGFDRLEARYILSATLHARTAFRVGAGRRLDAASTDLPVLRAGETLIIAPGSSLKGLMRSGSEQLLRGVAPDEAAALRLYACDPFFDPCFKDEAQDKALADELDRLPVAERVRRKRALAAERLCLACHTFGSQGRAAVARFTDAPILDARVSVRDGVGMERDLRRAADRIKYDYEVVEPGARFELQVHLLNPLPWQVGLLLAALDRIDEGSVRIGGFGSRGLGWFSVEETRLERRGLAELLGRGPAQICAQEAYSRALVEALQSNDFTRDAVRD